MPKPEATITVKRKDIERELVNLYSNANRLKEKRKVNFEHLKKQVGLSVEEIAKHKSMLEINLMIENNRCVECYLIEINKEFYK